MERNEPSTNKRDPGKTSSAERGEKGVAELPRHTTCKLASSYNRYLIQRRKNWRGNGIEGDWRKLEVVLFWKIKLQNREHC